MDIKAIDMLTEKISTLHQSMENRGKFKNWVCYRLVIAMGVASLLTACGLAVETGEEDEDDDTVDSTLTYSQTVSAYADEGLDSATRGDTLNEAYNALLALDIANSDPDTTDATLAAFVDAFDAYNTNIQRVRSYATTTFELDTSENVTPLAVIKQGKPGTSVPGTVGMLAGQTLGDFHDKLTAKKAECDALLASYKSTSDIIKRAEILQAHNLCAVELQALGAKEGFKIVVVKAAGGTVGGATGKIVGTSIVYYFVGAAALATPGGLLVVAATTIGGGILGSKISGAIFDYCTSSGGTDSSSKLVDSSDEVNAVVAAGSKAVIDSGEYCTVASASGTSGSPMAMVTSPGTGTLQVFVEGYAPVSIAGVTIAPGQTLTVNVTLEALADVTDDSSDDVGNASSSTTTASTTTTASSCAEVISVTADNAPAVPSSGDPVTVTATIIPVLSGCTVSYAISGTDGYSKSGSDTTDASGQIIFTIPGGAANVHDVVTISESASGSNTTLGYAFQ